MVKYTKKMYSVFNYLLRCTNILGNITILTNNCLPQMIVFNMADLRRPNQLQRFSNYSSYNTIILCHGN